MKSIIIATAMAASAIIGILTIGYLYRTGPQADELVWSPEAPPVLSLPIRVWFQSDDDPLSHINTFGTLQDATEVWNQIMYSRREGRLFYVISDRTQANVRVKSADGEPCGVLIRPVEESQHTARTYYCGNGIFEILVDRPGNVRTQFCIYTHELGHVLGLADDTSLSVMNPNYCPDVDERILRVSDKDASAVAARYKRKN